MMSKKILIISHGQKRDCTVGPLLTEKGYLPEWRHTALGDPLPETAEDYWGAVVLGGKQSANDAAYLGYLKEELCWIDRFLRLERPLLGICLGSQLIARVLGARVGRDPEGHVEIGYFPLYPTASGSTLFQGLAQVYHWHEEGWELPRGCTLLATGDRFANQAFSIGGYAYGFQFHPEISLQTLQRWSQQAADHLHRPGAHSPDRQLTDSTQYLATLQRWFSDFLDHWLAKGNEKTG